MTTSADFTPEEWEVIREAPTGAGLIVASASRGGSFRESFSMAKAYTEARQQHGESELLDELVASRPKVDHTRAHSVGELQAHHLEQLRGAIAALEQKATPEEVEEYRRFVRGLSERVAEAHKEGGETVSDAERSVLDQIEAALGG
jgi:hypothetical protein